ncbi:acetyl esterase/lipase [Amycolatopsis bartoniae]|uniref:Esterase n=1 Tax=Amycolatopsis bartoniae TaxID=941986 RepID=A0A8H9IUE1_9PSEU|nr:alpha/beta hydrolase fold domain-containing protein [Amycolatopsis bartoniae]MBB2937168.1 acetyl esterase/lipase [Amycolatopsis bartoniae]GHF52945.1 esterase [Amycolatopsis bartoniae]
MTSTDTPVGPPPPFDPELAAALVTVQEQRGPQVLDVESLPAVRAARAQDYLTVEELTLGGRYAVAERAVPGLAGAPDVPLLVCRPTGVAAPAGALYVIHGGGMILGSYRSREIGAVLADVEELGLVLVAVDYRLAPENPFPAGLNDCYAGLLWTVEHAGELGFDPARVVVAGGSAGGGLAAGVALRARDEGGPALLGQLLQYPMLDDRNDTCSARQMAGLGVWDRTANEFGWTALLGAARGGPDVSPYAAPARATDLSGLPPAYLDAGSAETFRDEDVAYATRLWQAGGEAELHVWPGGFHGFDLLAPQATLSRIAREQRVSWLRRLFAR